MVHGDSLIASPSIRLDAIQRPSCRHSRRRKRVAFSGPNRSISPWRATARLSSRGKQSVSTRLVWQRWPAVRNVGAPNRYIGVRISPDGTEALTFVDDAVGNRDLWRVDLTRGARTRMTSDNRGNFGVWSRDGRRIAFSGSTSQTLFEKSASADTADRTLLNSDHSKYPTDWSRDGRAPAIHAGQPGNRGTTSGCCPEREGASRRPSFKRLF